MGKLSLKFGPKVPKGAVNLAWISVPEVTPEHNTFLADLAATIPLNRADYFNEPLAGSVSGYTVKLGTSGQTHTVTGTNMVGHFSCPISVMPPIEDPTGAWRIRVSDGVFKQVVRVPDGDKSWLKAAFPDPNTRVVAIYSLPEVRFLPKDATGDNTESVAEEDAFPLDSRTVQLSHRDLAAVTRILINDQDIDPGDEEQIQIDYPSGTITFIKRSVAVTDEIRVSYSYRTSELTYSGFYDEDGKYKDLDLNPAFGHTYNGGLMTNSLVGRVVTLYLIPCAAYDYDKALTGEIEIVRAKDAPYSCKSYLRWTSELLGNLPEGHDPTDPAVKVPRSTYGHARYGKHHFSATIPYEEHGDDNYSDRTGSVGALADYPTAVVLARVYVGSTGDVNSLIVTDTRRRGGGLSDDPAIRSQILTGEQMLEANTCWDISGWDGDPAMLNGTTVIEVPEALLTRCGGKFTEAQVEEIVRKRIPVGILPVIRYIQAT